MKYSPEWGSHIPVLIKVFELSSGDILELGTGPFSTPLLHWLSLDSGRPLISYENNDEYYQMHKGFQSSLHKVNKVTDWEKTDINKHWGMAFVDLAPARQRKVVLQKLVGNCDFVVVHDTEPESEKWYRCRDLFAQFKYRSDYTKSKPWTSVFSNLYQLQI
jgi:hypothetical protein